MFLSRSLDSYIKEFRQKEAKYENAYQQCGSKSSYRTREKYSDLLEICIMASITQEKEDEKRKRRNKVAKEYINRIRDRKLYNRNRMYTIDELIEELENLVRIIN